MGIHELLERMNLPRNHWDVKLTEISDKASHKVFITEYVESITTNLKNGRGLYISGKHSTGKSGMSSICLKAAASKGYIGLWLSCDQIPKYIMEKYEFDEQQSVIERAETVPILVLDEFVLNVSVDKGKKYARIGERERMIEMLVRRRIDHKRSTIITANVGPNTFEEVYPSFYKVVTEAVDFIQTDPTKLFRPHK